MDLAGDGNADEPLCHSATVAAGTDQGPWTDRTGGPAAGPSGLSEELSAASAQMLRPPRLN